MKIHISTSNSKLGKIPSFSTSPVKGCGENCRVCAGVCYALKSYKQYPSCRAAWDDNLQAVVTFGGGRYIREAIITHCQRKKTPVFRWFVSGDILYPQMLWEMVRIANECPNTAFFAYTKCYSIVNDYINYDGDLPANLTVIFSKWDGLRMDNPHNLPTSDVILKGTDKKPENGHICPNQRNKQITCDKCPCPCWKLRKGEAVYFEEH